MSFVKLGPATFLMGSPVSEQNRSSDEAQHSVTLTRPFEMQTTDVTQAQYVQVMGNNPSRFQASENCSGSFTEVQGVAMCPNHPVENVTYDDAQLFISRFNQAHSSEGYTYRLPTEAEWEYAARAGSQAAYSFGSDPNQLGAYAWTYENAGGQSHEVGTRKPNTFGLYDMHGNVWQWVQDWYDSGYNGLTADPQGPSSGSSRVFRGGSWFNYARHARSAIRYNDSPGDRAGYLGFRLVRTQ
jgi:formylglycine-generating enzyme required for sulfatase activity